MARELAAEEEGQPATSSPDTVGAWARREQAGHPPSCSPTTDAYLSVLSLLSLDSR